MITKATVEEYPQIRTMFTNALRAMSEGETEAEKQIVYVLNEARAALPCPAFVAASAPREWSLYVDSGAKAIGIVAVSVSAEAGHFMVSPYSGDVAGSLALAAAVSVALRDSHALIMHAATEARPKTPRGDRVFSMTSEVMVREVAECFAETAKARTLAPSDCFVGVSPGPVGETLVQKWALPQIRAAWQAAMETRHPLAAVDGAEDLLADWTAIQAALLG